MEFRLGAQSQLTEHLALKALSVLCQSETGGYLPIADIARLGWGRTNREGATEALKAPGLDLELLSYRNFLAELRLAVDGMSKQRLVQPIGTPDGQLWCPTNMGRRELEVFRLEVTEEFHAWLAKC